MKYEIDTNFSAVNYIITVNDIVDAYFDDKGNYNPAIGKISCMKLFYDNCVKNENKIEINELGDIEFLTNDCDFVNTFNEVIRENSNISLDFSNAMRDAMEIIKYRTSTIGGAINYVISKIESVTEKVNPMLTNENLNVISKIAKDIGNGNIDASAIVDAYADKFYKVCQEHT